MYRVHTLARPAGVGGVACPQAVEAQYDMAFIADYYKPDVAFLPIGGHFTMDPAHAAYAVQKLLRTKTVVPMHYGTFPPLKGTPEAFKAALGDYYGEVVVMAPGETRTF